MPRARNAKADEALALYRQGKKLIDIAKELDIPEGTVRRWKCTWHWDDEKGERSKKKASARKRGGQPGNRNRAAPKGNKRAEKYGFFSKWLPSETLELLNETEDADPLDLLWQNIRFQYAAIVRAQKIAYVKDQEDHTTDVIGESISDSGSSTTYAVQHSWDKQANFLQAQSRAMETLRNMIKQYDEMLHRNWDLATDEQKTRLEVLRSKLGTGGEEVQKVTIINDTREDHPDQ